MLNIKKQSFYSGAGSYLSFAIFVVALYREFLQHCK